MSTQKQRQAARANGAKSRGPITPEGKARSALNAVVYGFSSTSVLLGCEPEEEFNNFRSALFDDLAPQSAVELEVFEQYVSSLWRYKRITAMEGSLMDIEIDAQQRAGCRYTDPATRMVLAFEVLSEKSSTLELLHRYETRQERNARRALLLLLDFREKRFAERTQQPATPVESSNPDPLPAASPMNPSSSASPPAVGASHPRRPSALFFRPCRSDNLPGRRPWNAACSHPQVLLGPALRL